MLKQNINSRAAVNDESKVFSVLCGNLSRNAKERICRGFRSAYLLRCELNEFLQRTANASHPLHSLA